MHKLQSIWILGLVCLILACGNRQKESQYASMPKELAEIYRKIDKNPRNANLYFELSDYYMSVGRLDSALNIAFSAIRLDSANSTFYVKLSDIYFAMANAEMAEETLEKAIVLDKKNNEAYLKLGELYYLLENYAQAEEILIKAIHLQTHNPRAYHLLGRSSREKGDTTMAIRHYLKSVEQKSDYFETYEELALLYHNRRDPLAIDFYNNALNAQPNQAQTLQTLYNMAMFYQETGSYEKALEKYRMMLQIEPKNKYALHNMGWIYLEGEDKYEEAVVFFTKAIEQDSTYVEAVFNRGLSFEYLKQYDNARQDYMYSLHLVNNYPKALEKLNHLDKLQKR